jgi:hypothetical protein
MSGQPARGRPSRRQRSSPAKTLSRRKTKSINMKQLRVSGHIRRVGNGLALLIPVREARKAGLAPGDPVDAVIQSGVPEPLGLLKDLNTGPFVRAKEKLWRDRI